jgi:hypothetical protein
MGAATASRVDLTDQGAGVAVALPLPPLVTCIAEWRLLDLVVNDPRVTCELRVHTLAIAQ